MHTNISYLIIMNFKTKIICKIQDFIVSYDTMNLFFIQKISVSKLIIIKRLVFVYLIVIKYF